MRRTTIAIALALAVTTAFAQKRNGVYKASEGKSVSWSINEHQSLIWDGQPYLPVGIRIDGTVAAVNAAKSQGIRDVIVDLPANGLGWAEVLNALNQSGMHFLIRVDSLAPTAPGFAIEPQAYRITGITQDRTISLEIPGAKSAFVVLATKNDGQIVASSRETIKNGLLIYDAKPGAEIEHVLLVYPELNSIEQPDLWEGLDQERDSLLAALRHTPLGNGLRGIVNPMGRTLALPGKEPRFVPTSPYFRMEFRDYLEEKYKSIETLLKTWSMSSSELSQVDDSTKKMIATFSDFAKLIPLWSSSRGVGAMLDPTTNKVYSCDNRRSKAWEDIAAVINAASERRFRRLIPSLRSVADVPVIQDWQGWAEPYENEQPIIDGVGMKATGTTQSALMDTGSRAASSILRWKTNGWLVATDVDLGANKDSATQLGSVLDDLGSLGARGFFVHAETASLVKSVAEEATKRSTDTSLSTTQSLPIYFPENALNPAVPQRLPGGHWWLPCPADGDRIDYGSLFYGYRLRLDSGIVVIWAKTPGRYRLRFTFPKNARFQSLDGSDLDPKLVKGAIEVNLNEVPVLVTGSDEIPVPEPAFIELEERYRTLLAIAESSMRDTGEERMAFMDVLSGFERNPGGSFVALSKAFRKLSLKVSPYCWIEGERTADTNFSDVVTIPGCAGGNALSLRTPISPGLGGYFATYNVPVKTKEPQDIWLAAKIPAERRGDVSISFGGQVLRLNSDPISLYGTGFGWYKVGKTRFAGTGTKMRLQVDSGGTSEIMIDAILITPDDFQPNGVTIPDAAAFRKMQIKQPAKNGKKKGSAAP